jgi:hypothetical protein
MAGRMSSISTGDGNLMDATFLGMIITQIDFPITVALGVFLAQFCSCHCHVNRFNATGLLEKLRNKRLVFVGDSLNRNQWVSLVCMVEASIPDDRLKMRVFNGSLISFKAFVCFFLHKPT